MRRFPGLSAVSRAQVDDDDGDWGFLPGSQSNAPPVNPSPSSKSMPNGSFAPSAEKSSSQQKHASSSSSSSRFLVSRESLTKPVSGGGVKRKLILLPSDSEDGDIPRSNPQAKKVKVSHDSSTSSPRTPMLDFEVAVVPKSTFSSSSSSSSGKPESSKSPETTGKNPQSSNLSNVKPRSFTSPLGQSQQEKHRQFASPSAQKHQASRFDSTSSTSETSEKKTQSIKPSSDAFAKPQSTALDTSKLSSVVRADKNAKVFSSSSYNQRTKHSSFILSVRKNTSDPGIPRGSNINSSISSRRLSSDGEKAKNVKSSFGGRRVSSTLANAAASVSMDLQESRDEEFESLEFDSPTFSSSLLPKRKKFEETQSEILSTLSGQQHPTDLHQGAPKSPSLSKKKRAFIKASLSEIRSPSFKSSQPKDRTPDVIFYESPSLGPRPGNLRKEKKRPRELESAKHLQKPVQIGTATGKEDISTMEVPKRKRGRPPKATTAPVPSVNPARSNPSIGTAPKKRPRSRKQSNPKEDDEDHLEPYEKNVSIVALLIIIFFF